MKTYKLIKTEDYAGLFKVSLVDDPAIQSNLIHLSEEKEFLFQDEEQRIIYAPALIPNKLIFRKNINGEPANVYFDAETIKDLHIDGMRKGYDNKVNLNHESKDTDGIFCFEQWIIEDAVNDKSVKLGFELPIGTLMKGYKIDNDQVWSDIKDGKLKGLSIEGQLFPEEQKVNLKTEINMNKKGAFALAVEKFKAAFVAFEGEDDKDKEEEILPIEEKDTEEEVLAEETPVEDPAADEKDAKITDLETKIAELEAQLTEATATKMSNEEAEVKLKADFEEATKENTKLQAELVELKRIPNIPVEAQMEFSKMTPLQKQRYHRENNK